MEATASVLAPYFQHRVSECGDILKKLNTHEGVVATVHEELDEHSEGTLVDLLQHVAGVLNPADLPSRPDATVSDVQPGSVWRSGPDWLRGHRSQWPMTRDFIREVPAKEKRSKIFKLMEVNMVHASNAPTKTKGVIGILWYSNKMDKVINILARYVKACKGTRGHASLMLRPEDIREAEKVFYLLAMPMTRRLEAEGRLESLKVFWCEGICYTTGRWGADALERILGVDKLIVLSSKSRAAHLILIKAHEEDHRRDWKDTVWRARKYAWIPNSSALAKSVVKNCQKCKVASRELLNQRMGDLPEVMSRIPCRPYTHVCLDYAGPVTCASMTNRRKKLKCYILVIVCMNTSHIDLRLTSGYSTDEFLTQFFAHCLETTTPAFVYTDSGSNLVAAKKVFTGEDDDHHEHPDINWDEVRDRTQSKKIQWKIAPPGCQWRDGRSEACVKAAKKSLRHLGDSASFTFEEKQVMLAMARKCLNDRPLGAKFHNGVDPGYSPITPNLLVHGYYEDKDEAELTGDLESMGNLVNRVKLIQARHAAWWEVWYRECFEQMMPLPKWKVVNRNLQAGDICLLGFHTGLGPGQYKLCKVTKTFLDQEGLVRDVEIILRPRGAADQGTKQYKPTKMRTMVVGIQRLVLICRVEDAHETTDPADLHPRVHAYHVEGHWPLFSESNSEDEYEDLPVSEDTVTTECFLSHQESSCPDSACTAVAVLSDIPLHADLACVDISAPIIIPVISNLPDQSIGPNDFTDPDDSQDAVDLIPDEPDLEPVSICIKEHCLSDD